MLEGVESLREVILRGIHGYILAEVDQLCEGVDEFQEYTSGSYDEYEGVHVFEQTWVTYRVPTEVSRFGFSVWRFDGNLGDLITRIDHWRARQ